jgi:hypothetical protein
MMTRAVAAHCQSPSGRGAVALLAQMSDGEQIGDALEPGRHAWLQRLRGKVTVDGSSLKAGDGAAINEETSITITARRRGDCSSTLAQEQILPDTLRGGFMRSRLLASDSLRALCHACTCDQSLGLSLRPDIASFPSCADLIRASMSYPIRGWPEQVRP